MKQLLLTCVALGAMTSAVLAEPVQLTSAQLDQATAAGYAGAIGAGLGLGRWTSSTARTDSTWVQHGRVGAGVAVGFGSGVGIGPGADAAAESGAATTGDLVFGHSFNVGVGLPGVYSAQALSIAVGVDLP